MIDDSDIKYLDRIYKRLDDCDREMKVAADEHHSLDKRLSVIEAQQKLNNWLTAAIAGGIIALVIRVFMGG